MSASRVDPAFAKAVATSDEFDAWACMNCGVCSAVCPMGIDILPRKLFRLAILGLKDDLLAETDTIFTCLLCKLCEENCTAGLKIAENVRFLRGYIDEEVFGLDAGRGKEGSHVASHG